MIEMFDKMNMYIQDFLVTFAEWLVECNVAFMFVGLGVLLWAFGIFRELVRR